MKSRSVARGKEAGFEGLPLLHKELLLLGSALESEEALPKAEEEMTGLTFISCNTYLIGTILLTGAVLVMPRLHRIPELVAITFQRSEAWKCPPV